MFLPVEHLGLCLGERFAVDEADGVTERLVHALDGGISVSVGAEQAASTLDEGVEDLTLVGAVGNELGSAQQ